MEVYKDAMKAVCGPECDFADEAKVTPIHETAHTEALALFSTLATFGKEEDIATAKVNSTPIRPHFNPNSTPA